MLFMLMPHTLVPLTALLYATGMIHDEIEEQTLTYLLVRPLPKWGIYLTKLLATHAAHHGAGGLLHDAHLRCRRTGASRTCGARSCRGGPCRSPASPAWRWSPTAPSSAA